MALHLVTGYAGREHVTSADQGSFNIAMMGDGQFVMDRGNQFDAQIISNNKVRVLDGDILMQGRQIRQKENTYTELEFENGQQGMKRNDLIVVRYSKDSTTGIESSEFKVLKGIPTDGTPSDPEFVSGDITEETGDLVNDFPLYRIPFDSLTIQNPIKLFTTVPTWKNLQEEALNDVREEFNTLVSDFKKNTKYEVKKETLNASGWSNEIYSFELTYPQSKYDLEIELDGDSVTVDQMDAWNSAKIAGSTVANRIKALGDVPTTDIPVVLKVVSK